LGTCPKHPAHYTTNPSAQLRLPSSFIRMMEKEEQASPRTAHPSLLIRMKVVSWGHSLVQETLDSIDEVWRCQDPKAELPCYFLRHSLFARIFLAPFCQILSFLYLSLPITQPEPNSLLPSTSQHFTALQG